tara:strand:+ start:183 stop:452 length:270 start_codon:yes stop_codon:yes gene_type:complete
LKTKVNTEFNVVPEIGSIVKIEISYPLSASIRKDSFGTGHTSQNVVHRELDTFLAHVIDIGSAYDMSRYFARRVKPPILVLKPNPWYFQ